MIYVTPTRTFGTLRQALDNGESFVTATADHAYAEFIDWAEMDEGEREALRELQHLSEAEIEQELMDGIEAVDIRLELGDDLTTLFNWLEDQGAAR